MRLNTLFSIANCGRLLKELYFHLENDIICLESVVRHRTTTHPVHSTSQCLSGGDESRSFRSRPGLKVGARGRILSVDAAVAKWVEINGCSTSPTVTYEPDAADDDTRVRHEGYAGGEGDTEVVLCVVEGGGHTWPGGWQYLPERVIGKTSRDIDAGEVIWDFFRDHPKN